MAVLAAGLFYALQKLFPLLTFLTGAWYIWWPANGIGLGVLLMMRRRHWAWFLPAFGIGLGLSWNDGQPWHQVAVAVGNPLEMMCVALVLPRFRTMDKWLSQPRIAIRFISMVVLAAPTAAALFSLIFHEPGPPMVNAIRWGGSDALGSLLFAPLLLALFSPELWNLFRWKQLPRTLGALALMTGVSCVIFRQAQLPLAFATYPTVLLLGTELGLSGAVLGIDILAMIATSATLQGRGPFGQLDETQSMTRELVLQLFLLLSVAMTLPVSVARVRRLTTEAQLRRAWKKMAELAAMDGLTGVANRRHFDATLSVEWARARRERVPLALLMIDADHFKSFNDDYGHLAGDACLRAIASTIAGVPRRPTDLVARFGGEEFAVLLPGADIGGAHVIAEAIRHAVFGLGIPHRASETQQVTVSIGIAAMVPGRETEPVELIAASDGALYDAKRNGRNQARMAMDELCAYSARSQRDWSTGNLSSCKGDRGKEDHSRDAIRL